MLAHAITCMYACIHDSQSLHFVSFDEVASIHTKLAPNSKLVTQYLDAWGCKRLTSLCLRRYRTGMTNFRDCLLNDDTCMYLCLQHDVHECGIFP